MVPLPSLEPESDSVVVGLDRVEFAVNEAEDAYYTNGADISRFDADARSWNVEGDIGDINGSSLNCAWNNDAGGRE